MFFRITVYTLTHPLTHSHTHTHTHGRPANVLPAAISSDNYYMAIISFLAVLLSFQKWKEKMDSIFFLFVCFFLSSGEEERNSMNNNEREREREWGRGRGREKTAWDPIKSINASYTLTHTHTHSDTHTHTHGGALRRHKRFMLKHSSWNGGFASPPAAA